jgi:hypothetical protein
MITEQQALNALKSLEWMGVQSGYPAHAHMHAATLRQWIDQTRTVVFHPEPETRK